MYNILYYHGLDSFLSDEKKIILEKFGKVTAPTFDYRNPAVLQYINNSFSELPESTVLIGSSFGGYIANILSTGYDLPSLLFNPALAYRNIDLNMEEPFNGNITSLCYIVLGKQDDVIKCKDNVDFISKHLKGETEVVVEQTMGHRIPVDIFKN